MQPKFSNIYNISLFILCSPVYPEEEADDENVVDDSAAAELTLDKIEDDTVLVILFPIICTIFSASERLYCSMLSLPVSGK